tara:strand:- start:76 stop:375 length:300 start_codon:yes stop_codon:yes gene_type:complete
MAADYADKHTNRPEVTMADFYGAVQGSGAEVHRLGSKVSGLTTSAASWQGSVHVYLKTDENGRVLADVQLRPWYGAGTYKNIVSDLPVDGNPRARKDNR